MTTQQKEILIFATFFTSGILVGILYAPAKGFSKSDLKDVGKVLQESLLTGIRDLYIEGNS